ncbi:MAG: hypothetical protein QNK37_26915 [Acidobacteriota bacterium]|nr:hypothetical protein [Acidobacteriota bacterium]
MSNRALAILSSGMVSSVGLTAPASCAAIRCGIDNIQETDFKDEAGEWIMGSEVPLEKPWRGIKKLSKMLSSAVLECLADQPAPPLDQIPVIFCLAEKDRPGRFTDLENRIIQETQEELRVRFHPDSSVSAFGRTSMGMAFQQAAELIHAKGIARVIIAGVDSLLVGATLREYEKLDRLLTSQHSNGFIPGESAAAVVVGPVPRDDEPGLLCLGAGMGMEEAGEQSGRPLRADGLVQAIKTALAEADCTLNAIDFRIADLSGGQYSFKEAGLAMTRLLKERREHFDIWHPADCIGEVGAAIGVAIVVLLLEACSKGYAPGKKMLCHLANEDEHRAALVLSYQSGGSYHG